MSKEDEDLRLKCLELVVGRSDSADVNRCTEQCVKAARKFYDFVKGKSDSEIIEAANEFAGKVTPLRTD